MRVFLTILFVFSFCTIFSINLKITTGLEQIVFKNNSAFNSGKKPNPAWFNFKRKQNNRKKIIASILAFPLPFGWIGVHRLYLGTKPYIPLIYAGTLGGCVGILPLIDFINLVTNKDISRFQNNPHIFMWVDNEPKK
jgi:TM2 domain-containing membrane protein YozV